LKIKKMLIIEISKTYQFQIIRKRVVAVNRTE
jgi:hypothetical protein